MSAIAGQGASGPDRVSSTSGPAHYGPARPGPALSLSFTAQKQSAGLSKLKTRLPTAFELAMSGELWENYAK